MRRLGKVKIGWSPRFSYGLGLITTDGSLSKDLRHINFTSKDLALIETFRNCFDLDNHIGRKARGGESEKKYYQVQFGDKNFYDFLLGIGLTSAKSKTIAQLAIPDQFFRDFLRGCIDGDGNISIARHPESRHPQLRVRLCSASKLFLEWVKERVAFHLGITGGWISPGRRAFVLIYAKGDSIRLLNFVYYPGVEHYLKRKYAIAKPYLRV